MLTQIKYFLASSILKVTVIIFQVALIFLVISIIFLVIVLLLAAVMTNTLIEYINKIIGEKDVPISRASRKED